MLVDVCFRSSHTRFLSLDPSQPHVTDIFGPCEEAASFVSFRAREPLSLLSAGFPSARIANGPSTPGLAPARQRRAGPSTSQPVSLSALVLQEDGPGLAGRTRCAGGWDAARRPRSEPAAPAALVSQAPPLPQRIPERNRPPGRLAT